MEGQRLLASEVVRKAEVALARAASLREEAMRLMREAESIEASTKRMATDVLGDAHGTAAFELARLSTASGVVPLEATATGEDPVQTTVKFDDAVSLDTPLTGPQPSSSPAAPPPVPQTAPDTEIRAERTVVHGVEVPASRLAEAEKLVAEARAIASQGKKNNPYAGDRGKNAWRRSLFKAVLEQFAVTDPREGSPTESVGGVTVTDPPPSGDKTSTDIAVSSLPTGAPAGGQREREHSALGEATGTPQVVQRLGRDPLDDDIPDAADGSPDRIAGASPAQSLGPPEPRPLPATMRAGFGNPLQRASGLSLDQARAGLQRRPPSFLKR